MKRHKFSVLREKMGTARVARNEAAVKVMMKEMLLSQLREQSGLTQRQLATALGIRQPTLAQMEKQDDIQVSTLRRLIEALGGELDLVVRLPGGQSRIRLHGRRKSA